MDLNSLDLEGLQAQVKSAQSKVSSLSDLEMLKRDWLGKDGTVKALFAQLKQIDPEKKAEVASKLNNIREGLENFIANKEREFSSQALSSAIESEFLDLSLPAEFDGLGKVHPITQVERKIAAILRPFGFVNVLGPEIESEYFCFDSLNIPKHHPARDMQDTFYAESGHVLRTHTTSVQARVLKKGGLPIKVASFGRVYRNEKEDASHQAMFHQFELVWLDEGLTLAHLMGIINHILKGLYGKRRKVRFVPKFYPYTEPSIGPQIDCGNCKGAGCNYCGGSGWVTVAGAGMVHRNVLKEFNYDPEKVSGFAFGLGTGRLAAQFSGLPDGRLLYDCDLRIYRNL